KSPTRWEGLWSRSHVWDRPTSHSRPNTDPAWRRGHAPVRLRTDHHSFATGSIESWYHGATAFWPLRSLFSPFQTANAMACRRPGSNLASFSGSALTSGLLITTRHTPSFHVAFPWIRPWATLVVSVLKPPPTRSSTDEERLGMTSNRRTSPPSRFPSVDLAALRSISLCQSAFQCQMLM